MGLVLRGGRGQDLWAAVGHVLLVRAPGSKRERYSDLGDVWDEAGILTRVAEALAPAPEPEVTEPVLEFGTFRLDLAGHSLLDQTGKEVPLDARRVSACCASLYEERGGYCPASELLQLLLGETLRLTTAASTCRLSGCAARLRRTPKHPVLIVTIPNSGYKFAAQVRQAEAAALPERDPAAAQPETIPAGAEQRYVTALAAEVLAAEGNSLPGDPEELRALIDNYRRDAATVVARHGGVMEKAECGRCSPISAIRWRRNTPQSARCTPPWPWPSTCPCRRWHFPQGWPSGSAWQAALSSPTQTVRCLARRRGKQRGLQNSCRVGQIIIAESTRRVAGDVFTYRDLGPLAQGGCRSGAGVAVARSKRAQQPPEGLHAAVLTPLVNREEELHTLLRAWQQAKSGEGRVVLLSGEPGIGKSRLLAALEEGLTDEPHASLRYFCSPLHQDSTFHPIVARWEQEVGFARGDSAEERLRKLEAVLTPACLPPEDVALIAAMLTIATGERYLQLRTQPAAAQGADD